MNSPCPHCGSPNNAASHFGPDGQLVDWKPKPGDVGVCIACGQPMIVAEISPGVPGLAKMPKAFYIEFSKSEEIHEFRRYIAAILARNAKGRKIAAITCSEDKYGYIKVEPVFAARLVDPRNN